jgi:hypothetical protein
MKPNGGAKPTDYPKYVWYFLAGFFGLLVVGNVLSLAGRRWRKRRTYGRKEDVEGVGTRASGGVWLHNAGAATVTMWNIAALHSEIPLGQNYSINVLEVVLTGAYLALVLAATFVNSEYAILLGSIV